jgi:hypothetical protein
LAEEKVVLWGLKMVYKMVENYVVVKAEYLD